MKKLIIVEGPMKVGKSHFIRDLKETCEDFGIQYIDFCSDTYRDIFINNFNESPTLAQRKAFDLGRLLGLKTLFENCKEYTVVVMDRFYLTNAIYAEAFSRGRLEYIKTIENSIKKFLADVDVCLIVLYDTAEGITSRLSIDKRNHQYTEEDVTLLLKCFADYYEQSEIENKYFETWGNRCSLINEIFEDLNKG